MGSTSVRKLRDVVANVRAYLAVEICCASQGVDLRADIAAPSEPLRAVHDAVRASVPRMDVDREVAEQIASVDALLPQLCAVAADGFPAFQ
jgi:histidine ammonia-lyase